MRVSPARVSAFEILKRVETDRAFSSVLLPLYEQQLVSKDRSLCHELVLGTLRKQLFLDRLIDVLTNGKRLDVAVRVSLRIGLYQILFLTKVPAYSAINESVNLVQLAKKTSAKGLINAVLRRATRESINLDVSDDLERVSLETSHPRWLVEKWTDEFGVDNAVRIAHANNERSPAAFRHTVKGIRNDARLPESVRVSRYVKGCYLVEEDSKDLRALADNGEIYFQDEASQMVAAAVSNVGGDNFLDVCAAPGSKTTQIACNGPRFIIAGDLHASRVEFLKKNCELQGVDDVNLIQYDAQVLLPIAGGSIETVLVDAPCSGTGTIRHNPEIRYFIEKSDFAELSRKQLQILENASKVVSRGGTLIYSTCSFETEENEGVATRFSQLNSEFDRVRPHVPEGFLTTSGHARTYPHRDGMDGFFVAAFKRR